LAKPSYAYRRTDREIGIPQINNRPTINSMITIDISWSKFGD
jgi:hypothetical protein